MMEFAICTSPILHLVCPLKFCVSIVLNFSQDDCNTQANNIGGTGRGANKVYYGRQTIIWCRAENFQEEIME